MLCAGLGDLRSEGFTCDITHLNQLLLEPWPQLTLVGSVYCPTPGRKAKLIGQRMHKILGICTFNLRRFWPHYMRNHKRNTDKMLTQ